jgi:GDPmannose 4,6-dehydratase
MKKKIALITGITGQDGSYLAELLLSKNYIVHGLKRRSSSYNTQRIDHIYIDSHYKTNFFMHYSDLVDANSLNSIIKKIQPDEIYNLAAQSHVQISFEMPVYTAEVDALGVVKILESIRQSGLKKTKFYQASTSEIYGNSNKSSQNENTRFAPNSPYATSKLFAYWITRNYRDSYGIFAANGILFNHESPRRGETFVTRKITLGLSRIALGIEKCIFLGNIYSERDWGHAREYALMQWKILQQKQPDDFVIATGRNYSVKYFIEECCKCLDVEIAWSGKGLGEFAYIKNFDNKKFPLLKKRQKIVRIDKKYFRPNDVNFLRGDSTKAKNLLKWKPKVTFQQLVQEMMDSDFQSTLKFLKEK